MKMGFVIETVIERLYQIVFIYKLLKLVINLKITKNYIKLDKSFSH